MLALLLYRWRRNRRRSHSLLRWLDGQIVDDGFNAIHAACIITGECARGIIISRTGKRRHAVRDGDLNILSIQGALCGDLGLDITGNLLVGASRWSRGLLVLAANSQEQRAREQCRLQAPCSNTDRVHMYYHYLPDSKGAEQHFPLRKGWHPIEMYPVRKWQRD
jgi:hypothetical protein